MLKQLRALYELQTIDAEIRDIDSELAELPSKLRQLQSRADSLQKMVEEIGDEQTVTDREARTIEGQVQTESLKVRKWEHRLNDIRNQREYMALSREVEASKRQNRDLEDQIGELRKRSDEFDERVEELLNQISAIESEVQSERDGVAFKSQELEAARADKVSKREVLLPTVDKNLLRKYDFIRGKRAGIGICQVVGGCCQGCYMQLPPQLYNVLQRGDSAEQCPSCSRLMIWEQFLESPPAAASDESSESGDSVKTPARLEA